MCEYCEPNNEGDCEPFGNDKVYVFWLHKCYQKRWKIVSTFAEADIDFCPMCGRNLTEERWLMNL